MHLLNVLTRSDIELTQNYLAMLASLLKEQSSHEVILLAFKHMYSALISQPQSLSTDGTVHILSSVQHMSDDFALKTLCP
jgi:trans-2-enoyl-CoA reductase